MDGYPLKQHEGMYIPVPLLPHGKIVSSIFHAVSPVRHTWLLLLL